MLSNGGNSGEGGGREDREEATGWETPLGSWGRGQRVRLTATSTWVTGRPFMVTPSKHRVMTGSWFRGACKAVLIFLSFPFSTSFGFTLLFFCYFHKVEVWVMGLRPSFLFNAGANSYKCLWSLFQPHFIFMHLTFSNLPCDFFFLWSISYLGTCF